MRRDTVDRNQFTSRAIRLVVNIKHIALQHAAQHARAADRFAHEIMAILADGSGPGLISVSGCGG
jgi:hypothetical protein